jgi:hypothetical protein
MPGLTRRRSPDAGEECWHVYYGDVHAGTIAIRAEEIWGAQARLAYLSGHRGVHLDADVLTADASRPSDAERYDMGLISVLIGVLVIVVVGAKSVPR